MILTKLRTSFGGRLLIGYVAVILLWFLLNLLFGDGFWWLMIMNQLAPVLFVPMLLMMIVVLIRRQWRYLLLLLLPFAIFVWTQGIYLVPTIARQAQPHELRVMTYNVLFYNQKFTEVADAILSVEPDLVALQEVEVDMAAALIEQFRDVYPYHAVAEMPDWQWGTTMVLSRYPVLEAEILDLQQVRPAMLVRVEAEGKAVTFISAHLYYYNWHTFPRHEIPTVIRERTQQQNRQVEILLAQIEREENDVILACDCNSKTTQSSYKLLTQSLRNVQGEMASQLFQPSVEGTSYHRWLFNVDYVMYEGDLKPVGIYAVDERGGSDHVPLIADFNFE